MTRAPLPDYPGFLGWTSRGSILVHADWPAYAIEHGAMYSLERLGQFLPGTRFFVISDIDQCLLLRVGPTRADRDDFDPRLFHVALWHDDVLELARHFWIEGVSAVTPRQAAIARRDELRSLDLHLKDGSPVPLPDPDEFKDDAATFAVVAREGMLITAHGLEELQRAMAVRRSTLAPAVRSRVDPLIGMQSYDAAIREACSILETQLRASTEPHLFGAALVEKYCIQLEGRVIASHAKWLRTELRSCFRFVRNDFMHNLQDLTQVQCLAIVCRIADLHLQVLAVGSAMAG